MPTRLLPPRIAPISERYYRLTDDYEYAWVYEGLRRRIVIPRGFVSDGASVPWYLWTLSRLRPDGLIRAAALVHDWIYRYGGKLPADSYQEEVEPGIWTDIDAGWERQETDRLFGRMLREAGVTRTRRRMAFRAVDWFGWSAWDSGWRRSVATLADPSPDTWPTDPIYGAQIPVIFAHRGGAEEAPESTQVAFTHGIEVGCDVLELDVQLTADDEIIVWHGPELDNVLITDVPSRIDERQRLGKRYIWQFTWEEINGKARVLDPGEDIAAVDDDGNRPPDRQIMHLGDFLDYLRQFDRRDWKVSLNIEPKMDQTRISGRRAFLDEAAMTRLIDLLERKGDGRAIMVASAKGKLLRLFRRLSNNRMPTNLSMAEHLLYPLFWWCIDVRGRALQTTSAVLTLPVFRWIFRPSVRIMHRRGGTVHVFLTSYPPFHRALRNGMTQGEIDQALLTILDTGVDGIMTDYPERVTESIRWILGREEAVE